LMKVGPDKVDRTAKQRVERGGRCCCSHSGYKVLRFSVLKLL
jgi:hypothetical protein